MSTAQRKRKKRLANQGCLVSAVFQFFLLVYHGVRMIETYLHILVAVNDY